MSTGTGEESIRVIVSKDRMTAEMLIPGNFPRASLTQQTCLSLLQQSGVEINDAVVDSINSMLANPTISGEDQRQLVAVAVPPEDGEPAQIEWYVQKPGESVGDLEGEDPQSHYDRSAYVVVKSNEVIGQLIDPTPGTDGRDVLGNTIDAKPGRPIALRLDDTVMRDASGQLIAQVEGVLHRNNTSVCVQQLIEVPGYVDFSTGHIDFTGSVLVHKGVRDCFVVKATGSVEVKGLIEAATIECGGNLLAHGGMAGRERGKIVVGGDLVAKYLDNIEGEIHGDLEIQREVINCSLTVHGKAKSPRGAIIGGKLMITGSVEIVSLGSGAGVATELVLGSVPRLEPIAIQLKRLVDQFTVKQETLQTELKLIKRNVSLMTATDKERQTELTYELQTVNEKLSKALSAQQALASRIDEDRTVNLVIHRKLFGGTSLTVGNQTFKIHKDVSGPLKVSVNSTGEIVYRQNNSEGGLLRQVAEIKAAAA